MYYRCSCPVVELQIRLGARVITLHAVQGESDDDKDKMRGERDERKVQCADANIYIKKKKNQRVDCGGVQRTVTLFPLTTRYSAGLELTKTTGRPPTLVALLGGISRLHSPAFCTQTHCNVP